MKRRNGKGNRKGKRVFVIEKTDEMRWRVQQTSGFKALKYSSPT
jgi:hypothetical protein